MTGRHVGIQLGATTAPQDVGAIAAEAEALGYGEIWLAEDYFELGGIASVGVALAATRSMPVGLGVVAGPVRHPGVLAMELATLAGAYPGRLMAGIGHGVPAWMRQMGLEPKSPMRSLREVLAATRTLLAGDDVTRDGEYFRFDRVRLVHPPAAHVPLYLGVHGPASLRLAGELADGTLLGWFSSPSYVAWARERVDEGRARASRDDPHELVALCVLSLDDNDPDVAREQAKAWATPMLANMAKSPQLATSADGAALSEALGHGSAIPPELLGRFVAAGDRTNCATTIEALLEAGADRVVLVPNPAGWRSTTDMVEQMRRAAVLTATGD